MPPDFYLNPDDKTKDMLEVKAFNFEATPGFDIAAFSTYYKEILREPYMLHCKYLIFGYTMSPEGIVEIKHMWLKSVWEMTSPMEGWPIKLQVKDGVVHKIRPAKWYAQKLDFSLFTALEEFISALEETVYQNTDTHTDFSGWRNKFVKSYKKHYKKELVIPKWDEIKNSFDEKGRRAMLKAAEKAKKAQEREEKRMAREKAKAEKAAEKAKKIQEKERKHK